MPTANRVLFRKILCEDFLAELNFMAGVLNARHPERLHFTGDTVSTLHAAIARPDLSHTVEPYNGSVQEDRIRAAAIMASALYGEQLDKLTEEQVKRYAISGVDRILEYLNSLTMANRSRTWIANNYLKGLTLGDARRWVTALPEQAMNGLMSDFKPSASHVFYTIDVEEQQASLEQLLVDRARVYSVASFDLAVLDMNSYRRETSNALHEMVAKFILAMQKHFAALEHPPIPVARTQLSVAGLLADSVGSAAHISRSVIMSIPSSPGGKSAFSLSSRDRDSFDYSEIVPEDFYPEQAMLDHHSKVALMALQARLHRLILRQPLTPDHKAKLTGNVQALLPATASSVEFSIHIDANVRSFADYLGDYLATSANTSVTNYFFPKTIHPLLIHADEEISRNLLFGKLQRHIATNAQPWLPILIRLQDVNELVIDSNEPFLTQYFNKGLGYSAQGVANLKSHFQFVFFFDGLDQCHDQELLRRIYSGEETAEWQAKLVFTARQGWQPPLCQNTLSVKSANIERWNIEQGQAYVAAPWIEELAETTGSFHNDNNKFFSKNPELLALVQAFDDNHPLLLFSDSGQEPRVNDQIGTSPVLLTVLYALLPVLRDTAQSLWPTSRHQLYAFGLRHYLGGQYDTAYAKVRDLALRLFQQGSSAINERLTSAVEQVELYNLPFLSGSIQPQEGEIWHRYAFTQISWRDYLIAEALWQACYSDEENPEAHLWNLHDWSKDYPGVLDFLADFLSFSPTRRLDIDYLQKQWVANGSLVCWQNVFTNTSALLERAKRFTTLNAFNDHDTTINIASVISQENEAIELTLKTTALNSYMCIRPHWEMRLLERLGSSQVGIKQSAFGALGHGAGISPVSPNYDKPITPGLRDDRRYYRMNAFDQIIASELLKKAHEGISVGNDRLIKQLVPDSWGFYKQDTLMQASQHMDEIDFIRAEWQYLTLLKTVVLAPEKSKPVTSQTALRRIRNIHAAEVALIDRQKQAYLQKCTTDHSWYNQAGMRVIASDSAVAERLAYYQSSVKLRTKMLMQWLVTALKQQPRGDLLAQCEEKINVYKENEFSHQEDIAALTERGAALLDGTAQRFAILMDLFASTRKIYREYTTEQQETLKQEIESGRLTAVVNRFKPYVLEEKCASLQSDANKMIGQARETLFLTWIEGAAPAHVLLKTLWPKLKSRWQEGDPEFHATRQQRALLALRSGDLKGLVSDLDVLFELSTAEKSTLQQELKRIMDQGRELGLHHYLQQLATWNTLTTEVQARLKQQLSASLATKAALCTVLTDYPQVFVQPTDDYLKRYLRFGLAVDACDEAQQNTLLFFAIKILGARESHSLESTQNLYAIVKYLINAGATVMVRNKDAHLNTPLAYVCAHREINQENTRWEDIQQALETVLNWFELQEGEDIIFETINRIYEVVDHYKTIFYASSFNPLRNLISRLNWLLRPADIRNAREDSMTAYPLDAEKLLSDRFHIRENMQKIKDKAKDSPTRLQMGRLDTSVCNGIEECERKLNEGIPQSSSALTVRSGNQNASTSSRNWLGSFFGGSGAGGGSSSSGVDSKEARRLRAELAKKEEELVDTRGRLANVKKQVTQLRGRRDYSNEPSQSTVPPALMTTAPTVHQANLPQGASLSQLTAAVLARNAENGYNASQQERK